MIPKGQAFKAFVVAMFFVIAWFSEPFAAMAAPSVPAAPTNLTAVAVSANQINLAWKDNSSDETGFEIWMKKGASGQWALAGTTLPNATNWGFGGLPAGTDYVFRVHAVNRNGRSPATPEVRCSLQQVQQKPTIEVVAPKGGIGDAELEKWTPGTTRTIRWRYTGDIGPEVRLQLYKWYVEAGSTSRVMGSFTATVKVVPGGTGFYNFVVPPKEEVIEPRYQMHITSTTKPDVRAESGFFMITGSLMSLEQLVAPAISITSPAENERWTTGSTQTMRWTYKANPPGPDVKIALMTGKTALFDFISRKTPLGSGGGGSFTFAIPAEWPAGTYTLRIMSTANESYRGERQIALIRPTAAIRVTAPGQGSRLRPGTSLVIRWTYTGDIGPAVNVGLFLRGSTVSVIASNVAATGGSGSCQWVVPRDLPAMGNYTIRVISPSRSVVGESGAFTIQ